MKFTILSVLLGAACVVCLQDGDVIYDINISIEDGTAHAANLLQAVANNIRRSKYEIGLDFGLISCC